MLPAGNLKPFHRPLYPEEIARNAEGLGVDPAALRAVFPFWPTHNLCPDILTPGRRVTWGNPSRLSWAAEGLHHLGSTSDLTSTGALTQAVPLTGDHTLLMGVDILAAQGGLHQRLCSGPNDGTFGRNSLFVASGYNQITYRESLTAGSSSITVNLTLPYWTRGN